MEAMLYASIVGSIMYTQIYTQLDISFATRMLGRYQSNLEIEHWNVANKVLRYLQGTKDHMFTYRRSDHLKVIGYSDMDFVECVDSIKSTLCYVFHLARGAA